MAEKIAAFFKKETILCVSGILALVSVFLVHPDKEYLSYINTQVLVLLFCLMAVMGGFQKLGVFRKVAFVLLHHAGSVRQLALILVLLCFFSAMLVTNDVALITFVPFTIMLLQMAGLEKSMIPIIVLQTIAANLGSMLTPIGNPQNLYLYTISGMSLGSFLLTMLPLTGISLVLLLACCLGQKNACLSGELPEENTGAFGKKERIAFFVFLALFLVCLMNVFHLVSYEIPLVLTLFYFWFFQRDVLVKVDFSLLLTFIFFFIFIGNIGRMPAMQDGIRSMLGGRELLVSFFSSQLISNVPAAVLLSGFTDHWATLLMGVNIGGLGTLIASMASLISYKYFVQAEGNAKGAYLKYFTGMNVAFAVILLPIAFFSV